MLSFWQSFKEDKSGHFAVQFALLGLPLVIATTFVVDYASSDAEKVNVKSALDAAVIAAVNNNTLTLSQKEDYAKTHFIQNYSGKIDFELTPLATSSRVEMSAFGLAPVTVAETLGIKGIEIFAKSAAEQTSENVICVLSLAPSGEARISFSGRVKFNAPTCSVHANSTNPEAIWSSRGLVPTAKSFCATGGVSGNYQPYGKGDCAPVADPYVYTQAPAAGPCINLGAIVDIRSAVNTSTKGAGANPSTSKKVGGGNGSGGGGSIVENLTGSNVSLPPGTYCGGLTVDGQNVTFLPGNHIMLDGPLTFRNGAEAVADDVTFVMKGESSTLNIVSGAYVKVTAPGTGALAGLVFFQDVHHGSSDASAYPNGINYMASGGELNITGTAYFPTQTVEVAGQSVFGSNAPATSFIAYNVDFYGSPTINVSVDHQRAGLPPIMPRTEDGARLVE